MKWNSTPVIAVVAILIFAAAAGLLVLSGGDDDGPVQSGGNTPIPTTPPRNTPASGEFGDAPRLGDNVETVAPAHARTVSQSSTLPPAGGTRPGGVCATVNFDDFGTSPETVRWFQMAFDGELVTQDTTVFFINGDPDSDDPTGMDLCYMPDEGVPVGMHTAAVSVSDPNTPAAPARQLVGWSFEVAP